MKKFLLLLAAVAVSFGINAADYTGQLSVNVADAEAGTAFEALQEASITLEENEGKYNFNLKNFILRVEEPESGEVTVMPVGNIAVEGLEATEANGYKTIKFNNDVNIAEGDAEALPEGYAVWYGPLLGPVPIELVARFNDVAMSVNIDIKLEIMPQAIKVSFIGTNPEAMGTPDDGRSPSDVNKDGAINVGDVNVVLDDILNERPAFPTAE